MMKPVLITLAALLLTVTACNRKAAQGISKKQLYGTWQFEIAEELERDTERNALLAIPIMFDFRPDDPGNFRIQFSENGYLRSYFVKKRKDTIDEIRRCEFNTDDGKLISCLKPGTDTFDFRVQGNILTLKAQNLRIQFTKTQSLK